MTDDLDMLAKYPRDFIKTLDMSGIRLEPEQIRTLDQYIALIQRYNRVVGVVATQEVAHLYPRHLLDSVSLAPVLLHGVASGNQHLDIGSGGGFPVIPLSICFPEREFVLVERSAKKCGFLRKVIASLPCPNVTIRHGSFPEVARDLQPDSITARAVEKPGLIHPAIASYMPRQCCFIAQNTPEALFYSEMFHVEPYNDVFSEQGWRRGSVYLVRKK